MKIVEIIQAKRWKNIVDGRTASIYGAVPYFGESQKNNWIIETVGYTWRLDNGTVGLGRQPVKTFEEAIDVMKKFNNRGCYV